MDIEEIQDVKTSFDRIGDRQFSTLEKKLRILIALIITLFIWYVAVVQWENYVYSFHTTQAEMVKKFSKPNPPSWKIVFNK